MFFINTNYKTTENKYDVKNDLVIFTVLKKDGSELKVKINIPDLEKVQSAGIWFAEWNKDFNDYIIQNISVTKKNKQGKPLKQSLQSLILDVNPKAPINFVNGDVLDNRRSNLELVERNTKNSYEIVDNDTIAVILTDKYGNAKDKALISTKDLNKVINDTYSWVLHKVNGNLMVIANTPDGRIHLDRVIMNPDLDEKIHHINLDPLDNTRKNLEKSKI